jgi:leader peptidase (prepilin peptidase) / N-methyltransferase
VEYLFVLIIGVIVGSFLNVCIYRLPLGKSIAWPSSHCPVCNIQIRPFDNIPVLSFLILRGKCRDCGSGISIQYPAVELLTAITGWILLTVFPFNAVFFAYWVFVWILIVITFIDLKYQLVPDVLSLPGILVGLAVSSFIGVSGIRFSGPALLNSLAGVLAGAGSIYLMDVFGRLAFPAKAKAAGGAVGFGDVKLMAMIGAFIGWKLVILTFFLAPIFGIFFGIYVYLKEKQNVIPYGPFLSMGAFVSLLYGNKIISWLLPFGRV